MKETPEFGWMMLGAFIVGVPGAALLSVEGTPVWVKASGILVVMVGGAIFARNARKLLRLHPMTGERRVRLPRQTKYGAPWRKTDHEH